MSKINLYHLIHPFAITHMEFHLILKTSPTREWYEGRAWNGTLGSYEGATLVSIFCIWHKVQCRVLLVQTVSRHLPKNPKVSSISQRTQTITNLINIMRNICHKSLSLFWSIPFPCILAQLSPSYPSFFAQLQYLIWL